MVWLRDGRALSASDDNTLRLWDLATGATLRFLVGHSQKINHVLSLGDRRASRLRRQDPSAAEPDDGRDPAGLLEGHSAPVARRRLAGGRAAVL